MQRLWFLWFGKEDVSGIYTDKQGTSVVYSELVLALQTDGTYAAEIGIYRITELKGTAVWEGDTLRFTSEDTYVVADISVTGSQADGDEYNCRRDAPTVGRYPE